MAAVAFPLTSALPDPDDALFPEVALAGCAEALIAGNIRHDSARARHGIPVLDPAAFLDRWILRSRR